MSGKRIFALAILGMTGAAVLAYYFINRHRATQEDPTSRIEKLISACQEKIVEIEKNLSKFRGDVALKGSLPVAGGSQS